MTFSAIYILFGAAILLIEAARTLHNPKFVLADLDGDLPDQSAINFRSLAGGAPLSTGLFLAGGLFLGIDHAILLGYLALILVIVGTIRLVAVIGKPNMGKQYAAVVIELVAAAIAVVLAI